MSERIPRLTDIPINRRELLKIGAAFSLAGLTGFLKRNWPPDMDTEMLPGRPKTVGTTFSQKQSQYLDLDYQEVFEDLCSLKPNVLRLCSYWDEFEKSPEVLDYLIGKAESQNIPVILAVGAKSPRYKEFHLPDRIIEKFGHPESGTFIQNDELSDEVLSYQESIIKKYRNRPNIFAFQIENEPLNKLAITYDAGINQPLLKAEIQQATNLLPDGKKIMLTNAIYLWPAKPGEDLRLVNENLSLLRPNDMLGLNVYTRVPNGRGGYHNATPEFWRKLSLFEQIIKEHGVVPWIAEAQAEPWEDGSPVHIKQRTYPSFNPERALNLVYKLNYLGIDNVLLWGFEHWYYHKKQGHAEWSNILEPILRAA